VVPQNFDEFRERAPEYIRHWVKRHVDRSTPKEDVEDWTQDLLIHLRYLPLISKHRQARKEDIVQTFDVNKHHGANAARFFNYINLCLGNKLRSIRSKRMKNPICRAGNVSLGGHFNESDSGQVDDEFCHAHSAYLRVRCQRQERQKDARQALAEFAEFAEFAKREDMGVLPAIGAILETGNAEGAAELLKTGKRDFSRTRARLRQLGRCFLDGEPAPRQKRAYKRRGSWNRTTKGLCK
jgi:hypothetical protein